MSTETGEAGGSERRGFLVPALTVGAGVVLLLLLAGIGMLLAERNSAGVAAVAATPTRGPVGTIVIGSVPSAGTPSATQPGGTGTVPAATTGATPATAGAAPTVVTSPSPAAAVTPTAAPRRGFVVANAGGDPVNLRRGPSAGSEAIASLPEGTRLEQIGPDREAEGRTWRNVRDASGNQGWIAATFTQPAP